MMNSVKTRSAPPADVSIGPGTANRVLVDRRVRGAGGGHFSIENTYNLKIRDFGDTDRV